MSRWFQILALGFWLSLAACPGKGEDRQRIYKIGHEAQRIDVEEINYYIEPAFVPLDIEKFKQFSLWNTSKKAKHFPPNEIAKMRIVLSFDMQSNISETLYLEYLWASPLNFAKCVVIDGFGKEIEAKWLRNQAPLWSVYVRPGRYKVLVILEPGHFSDAKSHIGVMNPGFLNGTLSKEMQFKTFIYGIGVSFIFFNLAMFLLHRKPYFIYYVGYSASILYLLAVASSHTSYPSVILWYAGMILNALSAVLMSSSVLRLNEFHPKLLRTCLAIVALMTLSIGLHLITKRFELIHAAYGFVLSCYFICVYAAIRRMLAGNIPAIFFASGWAVIFVGDILTLVGMFILTSSGFIWSAYIAYAIEFMLFAVALAYRTRDSEQKAIQDKGHAISQLQKVVYPHQIEQIKFGSELEVTMPTTSAHACVLSFDIVDSSKIKHIRSKEFFRNVFTQCNTIMSEGYDGINLKANAYRIKEMGDGFICSVGYPFQSMSDNPANDSIDMAKRFAKVLAQEAQILHSETAIACGIGIALDTIAGFYPETGTKEYDLYGQAIVLAKRYESMRKVLFEAEKGRSVLIIQEVVFQSLDPSHRVGFLSMDLKELGIVMRDDPAATRLYYQFLDQQNAVDGKQDTMLSVV